MREEHICRELGFDAKLFDEQFLFDRSPIYTSSSCSFCPPSVMAGRCYEQNAMSWIGLGWPVIVLTHHFWCEVKGLHRLELRPCIAFSLSDRVPLCDPSPLQSQGVRRERGATPHSKLMKLTITALSNHCRRAQMFQHVLGCGF